MNKQSHGNSILMATILATGLVGAPAFAQQPQGKPAADKSAPSVDIANRDAIVGAIVQGPEGEPLGRIADLVIDTRDGHVRHAVLAIDGDDDGAKQTAIAWKSLQWDAKTKRLSSTMTASAVSDLPAFQADDLQSLARPLAEASGSKGKEPAGGVVGKGKVEPASNRKAPLLLASGIEKIGVKSGPELIGMGRALFLEPKSGCVAFVTIAPTNLPGNDPNDYVVPWNALRLDATRLQEGRVLLPKGSASGREAMKDAPKVTDKGADVTDVKFRKQVYAFYAIKPPAFDSKATTAGEAADDGGSEPAPRK